jgi:transposase-like protein
MCILPLPPGSITTDSDAQPPSACPAEQLSPPQRQRIALDVLAGHSVSALARQHGVSRKFIRAQRALARDALDRAFAPQLPLDERVLFYLPVTRTWLEQLTLALVLICHSSLRGVHELLRDLLDTHKSVGSIHALIQRALVKAAHRNAQQDLTGVADAALDELFQNRQPILSVVDVASTYCCLLSLEQHRDGDTWGIRLLELQEQGFAPRSLIGDDGKGLQAGVKLALPGEVCRADVFHPERELGQVVRFLQNRAYAALTAYDKLYKRAQTHQQRGQVDPQLLQRTEETQREMVRALALADDVTVLAGWLRQDVLGVAGPPLPQRQELFDFVRAELQTRAPLCPHRLTPVCRTLQKQRDALLAFVQELDGDIRSVAEYAQVSEEVVRELLAVQELPQTSQQRWQRDAVLHEQLGERYHALTALVQELRAGVVRASSVVENVNSRLRNYFFLRKEVGQGYLELLRFFLNHRRFLRSEHAERVDKSPAELLTGQEHEHWLELLGYQLFRRAG